MLKKFDTNIHGIEVIKIHDSCPDKNAICRISIGFSSGIKLHDIYYVPKDEEDLTAGLGKLIFPGEMRKDRFIPIIELSKEMKEYICESLDKIIEEGFCPTVVKANVALQNAAEDVIYKIVKANSTPEKIRKNVQDIKDNAYKIRKLLVRRK